ncbi:MAG: histidine kinase [Alteromonadaceae bacterium]|nr:MAG: histidine kinase [Alteromonadaceae bacterium]
MIACIVALIIHSTIFWGEGNRYLWLLIICHTVFYPHISYLISFSKQAENRNILIDSFIYGAYVGVWGFNPMLAVLFLSGTAMTNMAYSGVRMFVLGLVASLTGALLGAASYGVYFRETLSYSTMTFAAVGLLGYTATLGYSAYRINRKLVNVRTRLSKQKDELTDINNLAQTVNANLDLDQIMDNVIVALRRIFHFEQVYILLIDDDPDRLKIVKTYGGYLTEADARIVESFTLSMTADAESVFVKALLHGKPIQLPNVTAKSMRASKSKADQILYEMKPSVSLAYYPLSVEGKVIGGFAFCSFDVPFDLSDELIEQVNKYLVQVGTAIRNAQLFQDSKEANIRARSAQLQAERSEEAKSRFLANMSHEIRTPLTSIIGYSEALQEENLEAKTRNKYTETVIRSGKHLLSVINDILDISKIEAHKLEIESIVVPLATIIEDVRSQLDLKAKEKGLLFSIEAHYPLPEIIHTDPTRLKQILFNLGSNAIKFTQNGSVVVDLSYGQDYKQNNDQNIDALVFSVIDTGIGLSEQQKDKVFDAFVQGDASTTRNYGGTGLGLYISKQLSILLGGGLEVKSSTLGKGSCFTATISPGDITDVPWLQNESELASAIENSKLKHNSADMPVLSGTVLVADDNDDNRILIQHLLEAVGLSVTIAHNGKQALELANNKPFDLILLDIQMPEMGGEEVAEKLRSYGLKMPLLAFTANVMRHQLDRYYEAGFDDYIGKPVDRKNLYAKLTNYLNVSVKLKGKVLVAEDNKVNQMLILRYIEKAGEDIEVVAVENGQEAIAELSNNAFDLVLMDVEMPVMDGITAVKTIREKGNKTPIYMFTGHTEKSDLNECEEAGADGHLCKPVDREALDNILHTYLQLS